MFDRDWFLYYLRYFEGSKEIGFLIFGISNNYFAKKRLFLLSFILKENNKFYRQINSES